MIGTSSYIALGIMIAGGILLPVLVTVWWLKKSKDKLTTVLLGAATWFVFAIILETVPKLVLMNPATSLGQAVLGSALLTTVIGALLAGIFEETGRLLVFKYLLKKRTNRETGISHGIGHGGMEALYLLTAAGVQYLAYAILISAGQFSELISAAAATGADTSTLEAIPAAIASLTPGTACLAVAERCFSLVLHTGLSVLVFYAVKKKQPLLYVLAILLHALIDAPAGLYQTGVIGNVYLVELLVAVYALAVFLGAYFLLYKKDQKTE